jgi:hypothetical protein
VSVDEPRHRYATEVLEELFPGATVATARGRADDAVTRTFAFAPSGRRPRLLVPTVPRDAAATALRAYGGRLTRQARWSYGAAARTLAAAGPVPLRDRLTVSADRGERPTGIDDHLSEVLERPVSVAVHLTPSRANRKPIVQALAEGARHPLAFAKVAVDPLTTRLVQQEAAALAALAGRSVTQLVVPTVAGYGDFAGHGVLTLHPLPTWLPGRSPTITDVAAASREVAALADPSRVALHESAYWLGVQQRASDLPPTARAERLVRCIETITAQLGSAEITFTASHGDWTPWNMWLTSQGLLVWDWERFETETPQGFDLLHFRLNSQFIRGAWSRAGAAHQLVAEAPDILGIDPGATPAPHTVLLYLIHLGLRYEADGQAAAGAALGHLETWLLPAVEAGVVDPTLTGRT